MSNKITQKEIEEGFRSELSRKHTESWIFTITIPILIIFFVGVRFFNKVPNDLTSNLFGLLLALSAWYVIGYSRLKDTKKHLINFDNYAKSNKNEESK